LFEVVQHRNLKAREQADYRAIIFPSFLGSFFKAFNGRLSIPSVDGYVTQEVGEQKHEGEEEHERSLKDELGRDGAVTHDNEWIHVRNMVGHKYGGLV
jgi:hypothetical protein